MSLRLGVLIFGGLLLVLALVFQTHPALWGVTLYFAFYGLLIVGGILFERSHYRPQVDRTRAGWQATGERFVDPTSGQTMLVLDNPVTGERDYVPVEKPGTTNGPRAG